MSSCEKSRTNAYSSDILWRVVWLRLAKELSCREIARQLCIGYGTVVRTLHSFKMTGEVRTQPTRPNREHLRSLDEYHEYFMVGLIFECPTLYLHEICESVERATNLKISPSTVCCVL